MTLSDFYRKASNTLRKLLIGKVKNRQTYINALKGKSGLEIGGPSSAFTSNGILPIYPHIFHLDNCNFSNSTVWEGKLKEGISFQFDNKKGYQYIREAADLHGIEDEKYDFLLSSHCLEHCANAVKTLKEWTRVVNKRGFLLIIVPHKDHTFDHNRPLTTLEHFLEDERNNTDEKDLFHLEEILKYHDLKMDKHAGTLAQFTNRSKDNFQNRCLHHHTFNNQNIAELIQYVGLKIIAQDFKAPYHCIILAQKG
jgi:SAM-dependent methyltransferase